MMDDKFLLVFFSIPVDSAPLLLLGSFPEHYLPLVDSASGTLFFQCGSSQKSSF